MDTPENSWDRICIVTTEGWSYFGFAPWTRPGPTVLMHELSIMEGALEVALDQARAAQARRIYAIRLRIGALSGVVPEALEFAFEALTPGTLADGATLLVDHVPARFWCEQCRQEFEADAMLSECPRCGVPSRNLRAGREMELASMEIE